MVSLDVWRARIGTHQIQQCGQPFGPCLTFSSLLLVAILHFIVFCILLMIGNVELNPGPESYRCSFCQKEFSSVGAHCNHQKIHALDINFVFECAAPSCFQQFLSYASLNSHISRVHKSERNSTCTQETQTFLCSYCTGEISKFSSFAELCYHLQGTHFGAGAIVTCPAQIECGRSDPFSTSSAFSGHLAKHHPGWRNWNPQRLISSDAASLLLPENLVSDFSDLKNYHDPDPDLDDGASTDDCFFDAQDTLIFSEDDVFEYISKFYLMLEVNCLISVANINKICQSLSFLSEMVQSCMRETVYNELKSLKIDSDSISQVLSKLSSSDPFYLTHHKGTRGLDLTSDHLRKKHYRENLPLAVVDYPNFTPADPIDGNRYAYIPLKSTLSLLLQDSSLQQEIIKSFERNTAAQNSDGTILQDYTDGEVCKTRSLPAKRIDLLIFQDAFSVTSMLTTVQSKYKTMGVYFTLGNFLPQDRTRLNAMHLIMLVLEKHCRKYRQDCWTKLVAELKDLERTGVEVLGEMIPVFLQFIIGDNLGAHFLGGFVESFRASHFCRFCEISSAEFQRNPIAVKPFRTQQRYNLLALATSSNQKHNLGVKEDSVFNQLENFKICDPGLPCCLGHDLFHGVAEWDLRAIITALVNKKWFTYQLLNRRISSFKYSANDSKNKPAPISISKDRKKNNSRLGGSALQNWKLLQLFPFIVQGCVKDANDPHWKLFLLLKQICELICAPKIHLHQVDLLESLIIKYLRVRNILPGPAKPKHHFLRHYGALIRKFGPLIHLWGMRFEQKHQSFKRVARTCNNFINILKTLVVKCQLLFLFETKGLRFKKVLLFQKVFNVESESYSVDVAAAIRSQNLGDRARLLKEITVSSIKYCQGNLLILGWNSATAGSLKIAFIEAILLDRSMPLFILRNQVAKLNAEFGIYHIDHTSSFLTAVKQETLTNPHPHSIYDFNDEDSFALKHSVL